MDGDTKKKVIPELAPRALFWFRWGAAFTWITGVLMLALVFYHGGLVLENPSEGLRGPVFAILALVLISPFLYDAVMKSPLGKNPKVVAAFGVIAVIVLVLVMRMWADFSYRAYNIHLGGIFGTIMAYNVWFRIWPAQQKIITGVKTGTPADAAIVAMAGLRSRHNTYLSVPLVWTMINSHTTWAASYWWILPLMVVVGWFHVMMFYKRAGKVKGF
jgi:uncharacterized membrane protein